MRNDTRGNRIAAVEVVSYETSKEVEKLGVGQFQAQPIHGHPGRTPKGLVEGARKGGGSGPRRAIFVELRSESGETGRYGPIGESQAGLIRDRLAEAVTGEDGLAVEKIHDLMLRLDRHGRSGNFMTAISAVDCAAWDLKGKLLGQPVYRLLGGPIRERVPVYASMLGFSVQPEEAGQAAAEYREKGYRAQKWFFPWGPASGQEGLEGNLAMAAAVREAVGPHYPIMFDAFMGWDLPFARQMLRELEAVKPYWVEEVLPPEQVEGFRRLKADCRVPLATGEHVYGRWQSLELLQSRAIDFLQNDPDWTGGLTELSHVVSLASAYTVPLIAHGHSLLPALHLAAARPASAIPYVEFLVALQGEKQAFQDAVYWPEDGCLALPERAGLGLELDAEVGETRNVWRM